MGTTGPLELMLFGEGQVWNRFEPTSRWFFKPCWLMISLGVILSEPKKIGNHHRVMKWNPDLNQSGINITLWLF
jgi:hypothetical protein